MTSINTNAKPAPFLLSPAAKDYLWGGSRLRDDFAKDIKVLPLAETWECSTHPDGESVVASGIFAGQSLVEVLEKHPEYLGAHPKELMSCDSGVSNFQLPILVKLIDAKENLSIQVHPDDAYACTNEQGAMGKFEMWYVLDAKQDAGIYYGFLRDMTREKVTEALRSNRITEYLQWVPVKKDDVFHIEPGTIHAIGAGVLLAEIQENSNLTYRVYDYDRVDKNGNKRQLHIEKALDVANLESAASPRQPMRVLQYRPGVATELLYRCKYFQVNRMLMNTEQNRGLAAYRSTGDSFRILLCVDGCGNLTGEGLSLNFFKGDCIFVPADSMALSLHGKAQFLDISC